MVDFVEPKQLNWVCENHWTEELSLEFVLQTFKRHVQKFLLKANQ